MEDGQLYDNLFLKYVLAKHSAILNSYSVSIINPFSGLISNGKTFDVYIFLFFKNRFTLIV
jgi:hypothetical protein